MKAVLWATPADGLIEDGLGRVAGIDLTVMRAWDAAALDHAEVLVMPGYLYSPAVADSLAEVPSLRWLHLTNSGYDNVRALGVPARVMVTSSPGAGAQAVAEHGLALMLALVRHLPQAIANQASQAWDYAVAGGMTSLHGRRLMVIGFGHIGQRLALLARAFGMTVIAVGRTAPQDTDAEIACAFDDLDTYLPQADIVAIAAPLTPATHGLFDAARLARLPRHGLLINLSRGAIVDSDALVAALDSGALAGAALDVTAPEPLPAGHPLWRARNLIITPHTASAGQPAADRQLVADLTVGHMRDFAAGLDPAHTVHRDGRWPGEGGT